MTRCDSSAFPKPVNNIKGTPDNVGLPLVASKSMRDTTHLLSNKANRDHLFRSIAQLEAGTSRKCALIEEDETR